MKVYIHSISYPPRTTSGAVRFNHALAQFLQSIGCQVRVIVDQIPEPYEYEGVEVFNFAHHPKMMQWADVVMCEPARFRLCQGHPNVVVLQHTQLPSTWDYKNAKIIYCSHHVEKKCHYKAKDWMVLYPTSRYDGVSLKKSKTKPSNITLINCNANKGGPIIPVLSRLFPDHKFTCILGDYGQQYKYNLKNVQYLPNQEDILSIYSETSVLILPSAAEGFPTVALEAMSLGVPVAAFPIDAMKEMLPAKYPMAKKSSAPHLANTINELMSKRSEYSKLSLARYQELSEVRQQQLASLADFILP